LFAGIVVAGTMLDPTPGGRRGGGTLVMTADLHVHPYPGDGGLPVWQLRREARRRGIDVIAVTGHNNRAALDLARLVPSDSGDPIVLPGQEITTRTIHVIAVGIEHPIDWRLAAHEAIAAIHAQGGVAIAAHPTSTTWREAGREALRLLDGAEITYHLLPDPRRIRLQRREFFAEVASVNPQVAPIGSTDFHMVAPLGLCRTYLLVDERSAAGALRAIRRGRTVARDADGRLIGTPEHVAAVQQQTSTATVGNVSSLDRFLAFGALLSLAILSLPGRPTQ
jgi:hypothetical protein